MKRFNKAIIGLILAILIALIPFFIGKEEEDFAIAFYTVALWIGIPSTIVFFHEIFDD